MSTTTIRIPDDLKGRVTSAAKNAGTTPHNFILQAISEKTASAELQNDFNVEHSPFMGRPTEDGKRELIIGRGFAWLRGLVSLYYRN